MGRVPRPGGSDRHPATSPTSPSPPLAFPSPPASAALVPEADEVDEAGDDMAVTDSGRRDRRPNFSEADDLLIDREDAAAKAHMAAFGKERERFS